MDEADRADRETERNPASALRVRRPAGPQATGACNFCGEFLPEALRWRDIDCREDWEKGARPALAVGICAAVIRARNEK